MTVYSENKKAGFDYEAIETYEAGLVLFGQEVKSIKTGHINLAGAFVSIKAGEPYLVGVKVPPYQPKNAGGDYNEERDRKLLLSKKEIDFLAGKAKERGFSLIPLKMYEKNGRVKLEFALAKGKKKFDKKEKIKERDVERGMRRGIE